MATIFTMPLLFRKKSPQPVLVDGAQELEVAFQVHALLAPLPPTSQARVLHHVNQILEERAEQLAAFDLAIAEQTANDRTQAPDRRRA